MKATTSAVLGCLDSLGLPCAGCCRLMCQTASDADVRSFGFMPHAVSLFSARVSPGPHTVTLRFTKGAHPKAYAQRFKGKYNPATSFQGGPKATTQYVNADRGALPAFELTEYYIGAPSEGANVVVLRAGLGKHARRIGGTR